MAVRSKAAPRKTTTDELEPEELNRMSNEDIRRYVEYHGLPRNSRIIVDEYGQVKVIKIKKPAIDVTKLDKPVDVELDVSSAIERARERFQSSVFAALGDVEAEATAEEVKKQIYEMLATQKKQMVLKLLGLRTDFGRVEIDSNNRGSNLVNEVLAEHCRAAVKEWLKEAFGVDELEKLTTKTAKAEMRKSFLDSFHWKVNDLIRSEAQRMAEQQVEKLKTEFARQFTFGDQK